MWTASLIPTVPLLFPRSDKRYSPPFVFYERRCFFRHKARFAVHNKEKIHEEGVHLSINKRGKQSFILPQLPVITHWASIAGKKESEGPLAHTFDVTSQDTYFGQKTWEQAEKHMQQMALDTLAQKAGMNKSDFDLVLSGDLLNQCIGSSFSLRNTNIPHLGLYGACSTMAESLLVASMVVGGGFADKVVAMTSSHFASSERQYRFPLGYGGQRTPTAQWTVTGSGAALVCTSGTGPRIECCTIGTVTDLGIKDAGNMGAAMAPAAFQTIQAHMKDLGRTVDDFDLIVTGDLGQLGKDLLLELGKRAGLPLGGMLTDCGTLVFDLISQDVHAGGSGCGCSAITLCGHLLDQLNSGKLKRILFCGTGALLSPTSTQQGLPIPGVCHAISIVTGRD
ncbi:MAG: stage V sporulation protein AD [Oscillospiraceae bacterium]|nr:stage V sporulation protein AD [Oscillospiraceae bacterium]